MDYDNTNRGAIWGNKDKKTDNHPDFNGSLNVEGKEYWVSGWKRKEGASPSSPAMSFSIRMKEDAPVTATASASVSDDDDVPF